MGVGGLLEDDLGLFQRRSLSWKSHVRALNFGTSVAMFRAAPTHQMGWRLEGWISGLNSHWPLGPNSKLQRDSVGRESIQKSSPQLLRGATWVSLFLKARRGVRLHCTPWGSSRSNPCKSFWAGNNLFWPGAPEKPSPPYIAHMEVPLDA